ncbi:MAG: restriction endonuclease [Chloroflexi bacterium]|nr:restriction endonuclease [Chloroflexota bacterium]
MAGPYQQHLIGPESLVTTHEATRAGFISIALEKNHQATPTIAEARALHAATSQAQNPADLLSVKGIEGALLTAAGISDKAASHLNAEDKVEAIQGLIADFLEPAGTAFVDELVYRFLLTRGETLGGSMRNIIGIVARRRFTRSIIAALTIVGRTYHWFHSDSKTWVTGTGSDVDIEQYVKAITWQSALGDKVIAYNLNVPLVKKNIDVCLLSSKKEDALKAAYKVPNAYVALGELKGGIDPNGADEHWKTANTALSRIRGAFTGAGCFPSTFFVGAAIVDSMSKEVWGQLETGQLVNAANLTNADQVASLCSWLVGL